VAESFLFITESAICFPVWLVWKKRAEGKTVKAASGENRSKNRNAKLTVPFVRPGRH